MQAGDRVGNYILNELVGRGAFAEVWQAHHHERPASVVAVKIATAPEFRRQLMREGRLPDIDDPHVVPILDSDTRLAAAPYIVMPYYPAGSLAELIARHPQGLPEQRVAALFADILAGLAAAHAKGIIHRGLKPANILLNADGRAVITDFGLSQATTTDALRSMQQSASLEDGGALVGTLAYMAPEVREGQPATAASDVYAAGVVLFEMLTSRRPFGAERPADVRDSLAISWDELYVGACGSPQRRPVASALCEALLRSRAKPRPTAPAPPTVVDRPAAERPVTAAAPSRPAPARPRIVGASFPMAPAEAADVQRAAAEALGVPLHDELDCGDGVKLKLALIPAGRFLMGSHQSAEEIVAKYGGQAEWFTAEFPQHEVRITRPFCAGVYPVTQAQYKAVTGQEPSKFKGDSRPVEQVSWDDGVAFCKQLTQRTGRTVRLPTEAEWEYTCRAGSAGAFCFGDNADELDSFAWCFDNSNSETHPVGQKRPNGWGLHDVHGNVLEWCADWFDAGYYANSPQADPSGQRTGSPRVLRGGSWSFSPHLCRSAYRTGGVPVSRGINLGFRVVVDF
jgi:formylglycine-generating enzyme required for sulfatase activity